ncbi:MAG: hypothetical protein EOM13_07265 [Clostridia bacterium]|nr:hypothetical protein [Clostridia bacterium]
MNIGKQGTAFSWNDRGVEGAGSGDWDAKGYFVEYGDSILGDSLPDRSGDTFASDSSLLRRPSGEISLTTSDWMDAATYTCDIVLPPTAEMVTLSVDSGSFSIPSLGGVLTFLGGTAGTDYVQYFSAAETFSSAVFSFTDVLAAQDVLNTIRFTADTLRRQTVTATSSTVSPLDGDMYFDGHFYRYIAGTTDWPTAVLEASTLPDPYFGGRGYSVTVTSQAENSILLRLVRNGSGWYRAWLGGLWQRNSGSLSEPVIIRDTDGHELTISDLADTDRHLTLLKDYSIHYGTANGGDFIDGALPPIHGSSDKVQFYWIDGPEAGEEIANNTTEFSPWHINSGQVQDEPNSGDFVYIGWGGAYWDDLGAFPSDSGTTYDRRDGYLVEFSGFDGGTTDGVIREASIDVLPAPVITGITPGDQTLSVSFSVSDPSADSIEYSLDNGLNWTAVSPISTVSPLVLSGLTNGTDYKVKIRMISQGTPGLESNMIAGRPLGTQTINFPVLGTTRYDDADFDPGASASSGLAITYSSSNSQVAIIDNQQISIVGAGTATITASQSGDSEWGAAADQSQELTVLPYDLVISNFTAADKIYDGTTHAMYSYQTNQLIGDDLALDVTVAFTSKDVTYIEPISEILRNNEVTLTVNRLTGSDAGNYVLAMSTLTTTATITPKLLTITGMSVDDKYYDRSMDATISGGSLTGVVSDDDVRLTVGDAVFAYRDAGYDIPVFADMYLQGSDADNYSLQSLDLYANIRPRPVRIDVGGAQDKVYDGTDEATLYGVHVTGVLSGDDARLLNSSRGYFSQSSPGYDLLVFPDLHLVGGEAGNYVIDHFDVVQASITPRPLTIAARSDTKLYGHDDPRLYYTSIGFAPGESMSNLAGSLTV